ncbi:hypothetical protein [Flammeovirga pacifica]|uniref:Uncharacterized protein n=1 Tax=Flammeovirga pacifica TaxID=915059 RepID=A0A1S1Z0C5_FLAPC|nr:hypothetical protein [Flammeovirga pacifica]OHX66719.1 hypothetical protein NH26_10300 [Flammeovirga pacifica]
MKKIIENSLNEILLNLTTFKVIEGKVIVSNKKNITKHCKRVVYFIKDGENLSVIDDIDSFGYHIEKLYKLFEDISLQYIYNDKKRSPIEIDEMSNFIFLDHNEELIYDNLLAIYFMNENFFFDLRDEIYDNIELISDYIYKYYPSENIKILHSLELERNITKKFKANDYKSLNKLKSNSSDRISEIISLLDKYEIQYKHLSHKKFYNTITEKLGLSEASLVTSNNVFREYKNDNG